MFKYFVLFGKAHFSPNSLVLIPFISIFERQLIVEATYSLHLFKCVSVCLQAHLVAAFEKSLSNMTCRLQSLTMTAEQKVQELGPELQIYCVNGRRKDYTEEMIRNGNSLLL